jgi:hypothetical protein
MTALINGRMGEQQALFQLTLMNAETSSRTFEDFLVDAAQWKLPAEVLTRLRSVWDVTRRIGVELVEVGKIIVEKILAFLRAHSAITWGLVIGAAVAFLVSSVPFLGAILAPLVSIIGPIAGMAAGAAIEARVSPSDPLASMILLAQHFFELLASIFNAVWARWTA